MKLSENLSFFNNSGDDPFILSKSFLIGKRNCTGKFYLILFLPIMRVSQKANLFKNRRGAESQRRRKYFIINTDFLCAFAPLRLEKEF
jgi:hypothetical protein